MKIKNKHIEFWGRYILVASVISLMIEGNDSFFKWFIWGVISIILLLYALNLKKEQEKK